MQVETSLSAEDMKRLGEAIDTAHRDQALKLLANPVAVHVNMLRGIIAKPSWQAIEHLYPEASALAAERDAATARAEGAERERDAFKRNMEAAADLAARYGSERDAATAERDRFRHALDRAEQQIDYGQIDSGLRIMRAALAPEPQS